VFVGVAMLGAALQYRLWRQRGKPLGRRDARPARVVDGEFRVLGKPVLPQA
jgi:hypothetical protein